jgi:hypothetical protein
VIRLAAKEARALAPILLASSATILLAALSAEQRLIWSSFSGPVLVLGYLFGAAALPAHAIGHEYAAGTLTGLLAQPWPRWRVFIVKLGVAAGACALLAVVFYRLAPRLPHTRLPELWLFALGVLFSIAAAPRLTMAGRTTLAGAVLTMNAVGVLVLGTDLAASWWYGFEPVVEADALHWTLLRLALAAAIPAAAVLSWRGFARLEAIEGPGTPFDIGALVGRQSQRREATVPGSLLRALTALTLKELRLQQLAFVLAAAFVVAWIAVQAGWSYLTDPIREMVFPMTVLYAGTAAIIAGAIPSADERQLGTHVSHLLLPLPGWLLWSVKFVVALAVGVLLGAALPLALLHTAHERVPPVGPFVLAVTGLTTVALFISASVPSGVGAVIVAVPASIAALLLFRAGLKVSEQTRSILHNGPLQEPASTALILVLALAVLVLTMTLAWWNQRQLENHRLVPFLQAFVLVEALFAAFLVLAAFTP